MEQKGWSGSEEMSGMEKDPRECDGIYTVESELIPIPTSESVSISRIAASPLRHSSSRPPIWISLFLQGSHTFMMIDSFGL
ncbi:hypothetical protein YC2023_086944 [Brassica napus]